MLIPRKKEIFRPNCKPTEDSTEGRIVLQCNPKLEKDGKVFTGERPTKIIVEGGRAMIIDDGGITEEMMEKLKKHIEKNSL